MKRDTTSQVTRTLSASVVAVPEQYRRVGSASNAPWVNLVEGNECEGHLLDVFTRPDERTESKTSEFFQIELIKETQVRVGKGEAAEVMTAPKGAVVNLNCNIKTQIFKPLVSDIKNGAAYDVFVHVGEKFSIGRGRKMWDITTGINQIKGPMVVEQEPDFIDEVDETGESAETSPTAAV